MRPVPIALAALAAIQLVVAMPRSAREAGDALQIALPLLGGACAAARGDMPEFAARFAGLMVVVHGLKAGLGTAAANQRPNGHGGGFPSGHTAAAAYGASGIARSCGGLVPYAGPAVAIAAGFVAGSRIESGRHDLRQVVAGAVLGLVADLGIRTRRSRHRVRRLAARLLSGRPLPAR